MNFYRDIASVILISLVCALPGNAANLALIDFYKREVISDSVPIVKRLEYCDSILRHNPDDIETIINKARILNLDARSFAAMEVLDPLISNSRKIPVDFRCDALMEYLNAVIKTSDMTTAYDVANELLTMQKPDSLRYYEAFATVVNANICSAVNDFVKAEENFSEADRIGKKTSWPSTAVNNRFVTFAKGSRAMMLIRQKRYDEAYMEVSKLLSIPDSETNHAAAFLQLGEIYEEMGKYDIAKSYYLKCINHPNAYFNRRVATITLAQFLLNNEHDPVAAQRLLDEYADSSSFDGMVQNEIASLVIRALIRQDMNDYEGAFNYLGRAWEIRDSIQETESQFRASSSKRQIAMLEEARAQSRDKRLLLWIVAFLGIIMASMGVMIMLLLKRLNKSKESINVCEALQSRIDRQQQHIESEEKRNDEITETYSVMRNTLGNLIQTANSSLPPSAKVETIIGILKKHDISEKIISTDRRIRKVTDPQLMNILNIYYPTLTKGEIEMCMFVAQGYSSKKIAEITNRSRRTVDVVKYHIRKKMDLPLTISLSDGLNALREKEIVQTPKDRGR